MRLQKAARASANRHRSQDPPSQKLVLEQIEKSESHNDHLGYT
jgi:hypothetical protein